MRAYKPHVRVAGRTSRRIDEVDGMPTTHKQHGWTHAWTVSDGPDGAAPFPVAAKSTVPAVVAVPAMCAVFMTAMTIALLTITVGRPDRTLIVAGSVVAVAVWCVVLMIPAIVRWLAMTRQTATRTRRTGSLHVCTEPNQTDETRTHDGPLRIQLATNVDEKNEDQR